MGLHDKYQIRLKQESPKAVQPVKSYYVYNAGRQKSCTH